MMKRLQKIIQPAIAGILILGMTSLAAIPMVTARNARSEARLQPALAEMAAADPGQIVRVVVQKADFTDQAERFVEAMDGELLKNLRIINSFAAEVPASVAKKLARLESVNWVSLDAPMVASDVSVGGVRDEFSTRSYNNNNGAISWAGEWVEYDVAGPGPESGNVEIEWGQLFMNDFPDTNTQPSLARRVELSGGATRATLSFTYSTSNGVDWNDAISVEVSADGGAHYTVIDMIDHIYGSRWGYKSYDISTYASPDTMIRFRVYSNYGGQGEVFKIDNVQIDIGVEANTFPDTLGVNDLHAEGVTGQGISVAVIDSGISNHPDLAGRLTNPEGFDAGDEYGHGTHVAGIIGGDGFSLNGAYTGIAPGANFINLGVSDSQGMAYESDVVEALQWVNDNKDLYNIRVVNLSLNSSTEGPYHESGIDAAVEILWFDGVVVVASSGNKGPAGGHNTAKAAPANDPFIISVGASNEQGSADRGNDVIAPFSAFGTTLEGYSRPDIIAPGDNIYSTLCQTCSWGTAYPERVSYGGKYIRLSGTSMAAPMVTGAVALLLSDEPGLTPDQVKYRLVHTASTLVDSTGNAYPYLDIYAAVHGTSTESANQGPIVPHMLLAKMALIAYWASVNGGGTIDWENIDWDAVNWDQVDWDAVNWDQVNWNAVNWNAVNWNAVNWNAVNWNAVNWNSVNWNSVNWNSVNWNSVINFTEGAVREFGQDGIFWAPEDGSKPLNPGSGSISTDSTPGSEPTGGEIQE